MRAAFIGVAVLVLTGCASTTATTISQRMEKVDTDAAAAYATVASLCNAAEAVSPAKTASAEALKAKAWRYFAAEHKAYTMGQSFDISGLVALVTQAKGL